MAKQNQTLSGYKTSLNSYETMYDSLSKFPLFVQEDWTRSAKEGTLDAYATALLASKNVNLNKYRMDYGLDWADSQSRLSALYTEFGADRSNVEQKRERYIYDEQGNVKIGPTGNPLVEEYTASDYDYNKDLIKTRTSYLQQQHDLKVQQELKDSRNAMEKFFFNTSATFARLGQGFFSGTENFLSFLDGLAELKAYVSIQDGDPEVRAKYENAWEAFIGGIDNDKRQWLKELAKENTEFEAKYTSFVDVNGEPTNLGKYLGGVMTSLGEMLPSVLLGMATGGAATAGGASASAAAKASSAVSQVSFYAGMAARNIKETNNYFAEQGVSVTAQTIIANAAIKSSLQWVVEIGLSKILGGSAIDNLVFGRTAAKVTGKTVASKVAFRVGHDAVVEGLEEVFQDTSDFLVDKAFSKLVDENYGQITDLSWQGLVDSFIIGALSSIAGSAGQIVSTQKVQTTNLKRDKEGNIKLDKDGNVQFKTLNKFKSWEYGVSMDSFMENFNSIIERTSQFKNDANSKALYKTALNEMYASYRILGSIYNEIGAERFTAANNILSKITEYIDNGEFNSHYIKNAAETFMSELQGLEDLNKAETIKSFVDAKMSEVVKTVTKEDLKRDVKADKELEALTKILKETEAESYTIAKNGTKPVNIVDKNGKNNIVVPEAMHNNMSTRAIVMTIAEQKLVDTFLAGKFKGQSIDKMHELYKVTMNDPNVSLQDAAYAMFFDNDFFKVLLVNNDKDVFQLITSIKDYADNVAKSTDIIDNALSEKIKIAIENKKSILVDYSIHSDANYNLFIDMYSPEERQAIIRKIEAARWGKGVFNRIITGENVTEADKTVIKQRIQNASQLSTDYKQDLYKILTSDDKGINAQQQREKALDVINQEYSKAYYNKYNGQIRMPLQGIPNTVMNNFLDTLGLDVKDLLSADKLTESDIKLITETGKLDQAAIFAFRNRQFSNFTNGRFSFKQFPQDGKIATTIYDGQEAVGFWMYKTNLQNIQSGQDFKYKKEDVERTHVTTDSKQNNLVIELLNPNIDIATSSYLSIDDVINNSSLLSDDMQLNIIQTYSDLSPDSTFLYLRKHFIDKFKNKTIILMQDGSYAFGSVEAMENLLVNKKSTITKNSKITDIIKKSYLYGMLEDTQIVFTNEISDAAKYSPYKQITKDNKTITIVDNTIYVSESLLSDQNYLRFAILHEFQHAVQFQNKMNLGISSDWTSSFNQTILKKMITELKQTRPKLFGGSKDLKGDIKILNDFVYNASSESTAMGMDASPLVDFYPVAVYYNGKSMIIRLPSGKNYSTNQTVPFNLKISTIANGLYQILDEKEYQKYLNYSETSKENVVSRFLMRSQYQGAYDDIKSIPEVYNWIIADIGVEKEARAEVKKKLYDIIDTDLKNQMLSLWYLSSAFTENGRPLSYDKFKSIDMPFVRMQVNDKVYNDYFLSAYAGLNPQQLITEITNYALLYDTKNTNYTLFVGTIKPNDAVGYIGTSLNEVLLPVDVIRNSKIYNIDTIGNTINNVKIVAKSPLSKMLNLTKNSTSENFNPQYEINEQGITTSLGSMSLKKPDGKNIENENRAVGKNVKYTERVWNEERGKFNYKYSDEYYKERRVKKKAFSDTNLQYFMVKGKRLRMDKDTQNFILNATGKNKVDSVLQDRIDGNKKGTLTRTHVMDYLRDATKIDDVTFKAINDAYFQNPYITDLNTLQEYVVLKVAQYSAVRGMMQKLGYEDAILTSTSPEVFDKILQIINNSTKYKAEYESKMLNYQKYGGEDLDISEKYSRILWMSKFDGSIKSASEIATIVKNASIAVKKGLWQVTGESQTFKKTSLEDNVGTDKDGGDGMTYADVIPDEMEDFNDFLNSMSRTEKINEITQTYLVDTAKKLVAQAEAEGNTVSSAIIKATQMKTTKESELHSLFDEDIDREYLRIVNKLSDNEIDKLYLKSVLVTASGLDVEKQIEQIEQSNISSIVENIKPRPITTQNITNIVNTIRKNLSPKDSVRFLKENGDIFNDDLTIKDTVNKDRELHERLLELSKDVRKGVYSSIDAIKYKTIYENKLAKMERDYKRLLLKTQDFKTVTVELSNDEVVVRTDKQMPTIVKQFLETELTKTDKTDVQYLSKEGEKHIVMNYKTFVETHAETLMNLNQAQVDELVDYFLTSEILPGSNRFKLYVSVQELLMAHLIRGSDSAMWVLTEKQQKDLETRLSTMLSAYATGLSVWRTALKTLKPEEMISQSMLEKIGVELNEFEKKKVSNMITALERKDFARVKEIEKELYASILARYKGKKRHMLDKILQYQRLAMLSGPGTWVRNLSSNYIVKGGNLVSEQLGEKTTQLLDKLFPKKKKIANQYKIVGTKIDSDVAAWVKSMVKDTNLYDMIGDGATKYDIRKSDDLTGEQAIISMIGRRMQNEIFRSNIADTKSKKFNKLAGNASNFIYKMISDDKWVKKQAEIYLAKMLTEDLNKQSKKFKIDLSKGLHDTNIVNAIVKAYVMASHDYMHRSNFFTRMESRIRDEVGTPAYFVYKQILPFAGASWNWFMEGLNYTPVGLAKSIVNYARLEQTIDKMNKFRQRGESVAPSNFEQYLSKRNIGKGIIGSIGFGIGILLAAFGIARIDDDDDKYKLYIGDVGVDISGIFTTQGIFIGIAMMAAYKDGKGFIGSVSDTLSQLADDSAFAELFNTFRYSDNFGDWMLYLPYNSTSIMIPNFLKTLASITNVNKVSYSKGIRGKFERLWTSLPGAAYTMPTYVDVYTGENQMPFYVPLLQNAFNKLSPLDITAMNVSDNEKLAVSLGITKSQLTGRYSVNDKDIQLTTGEIKSLNQYYGKLNQKTLNDFVTGKTSYKTQKKDGSYTTLKYSQMTDEQKANTINRIMTNNASVSKIYILTSTGKYKYFANETEYAELRKLGISGVYKSTKTNVGFV